MDNLDNKLGKVVTFYSFKGGVGRTMSLVNIACLLAKNNKKVLLIDWDLEAPGLHDFFREKIDAESLGLIDFVSKSIQYHFENDEPSETQIQEFILENLDTYITKDILIDENVVIDIVKAGKFDDDYSNRLGKIEWLDFYKESPYFFKIFAQVLETKYDYVFIDSRTGLSDTGGICTMLMPQILVLVFALNDQNINGVVGVAKQSIEYRFESNDLRNLNVLPLPSRIDNQNSTDLKKWIDIYTNKFENLFREIYLLDEVRLVNYFNRVKVPYKPEHAYGEKITVLNENLDNDLFISYHYNEFSDILQKNIVCWDVLSPQELEKIKTQVNLLYQQGIGLYYQEKHEESLALLEKLLEIDPNNSFALNLKGVVLGKLAKTKMGKESDDLYYRAFENFIKALESKPDFYEAMYNWGTDLGELAQTKHGVEADDFYFQAFERFDKAIELKPDLHQAIFNFGNFLRNLALIKSNNASPDLYNRAIEKYEDVIKISPDRHDALINWGDCLAKLAQFKSSKDAENLFFQAFEKFQMAVDIKPDFYLAYEIWGNKIVDFAKTKIGGEVESLYNQAFEKLQKASDLSGRCYNLSCLYALRNEKEMALLNLEKCLINDEINVEIIRNDNDWKSYLNDKDFIALLNKFKK